MFSQHYNPAFELDETVVYHELGHAFVWLNDGGIVDQIRFWRTPENLLAGGMRQGLPPLRPGETQDTQLERMWIENRVEYVRRLLAGELAARSHLNLPVDEVWCDFHVTRDIDLMSILTRFEKESSDIVKALHIAHEAAGDDWHTWISDRHKEARLLVQGLWRGLSALARDILPDLPLQPGRQLVIPGIRVSAAFQHVQHP